LVTLEVCFARLLPAAAAAVTAASAPRHANAESGTDLCQMTADALVAQ